jgi:hypothetical protein
MSVNIQTFDPLANSAAAPIVLFKPPHVVSLDLTQEMLDNFSIYVEMLIYKKRSSKVVKIGGSRTKKFKPGGFYAPSPYYAGIPYTDSRYPDWCRPPLLTGAAYSGFWTRMGGHYAPTRPPTPLAVDRPNHYKVNSINEVIPVYEYLNNRYFSFDVAYRDLTGSRSGLSTTIPYQGYRNSGRNNPTKSYSYSPSYTNMHIAFRYVAFDQHANGGRGQILNGPLSKTIKITHTVFPFIANTAASSYYGLPCADLNPLHDPASLICWIENTVQ